jgi:DNA-binding MarR family transcriptional regulator
MGISDASQDSRVAGLIRILRSLEPDLNLQLALTLLAVARQPGISVGELADDTQVPQQTASRYVAILQGRYELPGSDGNSFARSPLLSLEVSKHDPRRRALFLTTQGSKRLNRILDAASRTHE